ncbi:MAG TPA: TonB-dependent receptor, partial [Terriglobales bacterium]|nr:TonB-dependent receptor [Terriglobales bacterium]
MKWRILVCSVALLCCCGLTLAQSDRATINGVVKDSSGAVVPGVEVTVKNVDTNDQQSVVTNDDGLYYVRNLPVGTYTLTFIKPGFKGFERKGVTLQVSQIAEINVVLTLGPATETVIVTAEASLLQTQTAAVTTNLSNEAVTELPLNVVGGRNLAAFMFAFVPGVEGAGAAAADHDYASHIDGSLAMTKEVMIDGTSAVAQLGGYISESQPPMEAVREFQVETSGIRSDEGRTGGGVFRYEMKSGTNDYHGSAFGFLHNEIFDANSAANKLSMILDPTHAYLYTRPSDNMSDWGVSFGGPILKNKLFFYSAFERYMFNNWGLGGQYGTVPTTAMLNGDLSVLLNKSVVLGTDGAGNTIYQGAIFNPATGDVFVNNQIPTSMFSTASQKIIALYKQYYQPESANVQNNAMPAVVLPWQHNNEVSVKLDYNFSDRHHMYGSYIYMAEPRYLNDQGGIWSPLVPYGGPLANSYHHNTHAPAVRFGDSYAFSSNVLQTFRFTVNRFYNPSVAVSQTGNWPETLGLGSYTGNFPHISMDGSSYTPWNVGGMGSQYNDFYAANTIILNDDVSWVKSRHTYRFGGEFRAMQFNSHPDLGVMSITFDPAQTGNPTAAYASSVGSAWASFLLGDVNKASVGTPIDVYGRRKALSLYASDDFKVTSKLVLNLDLRWDYNNPYKEKYGNWSDFDPTLIDPVKGIPGALGFLSNGSQSFEKKEYYLNFAPHVGAAYQVTPKTVLRASFAIFYVPLNLNTWGAIPYSFDPGYGYANIVNPTGLRAAAFNWDNGYPGKSVAIGKNPSYTQWGMVETDPHALMPGNTQQWNVGVQRELTKTMKVDVSYVGSHSYHLQSGYLAGNQPSVANF